ncbi:MAG: radical SAM protein [Desulfurococcus sp.]|nr:radical SAM protein [Desulfurococcus sp.]
MEYNTVYKNPLKVKARVAYVYPSTYRVMISSLAADIIYMISNSMDEVYMERFTCKKLSGMEPEPRSLETGTPLKNFNLIVTTLHYEPDIVNLVRLLAAGGVPVRRLERNIPVIAGGPVVMENPVPYSGVIDAFIIGEAEATLEAVLSKWLETMEKKSFLEAISELPYVYVPGLNDGDRVFRRYVENLDDAPHPIHQVENPEVEPVYGGGFKLEVSRGCRYWCSFCMETRVFQPFRERSLPVLKSIVSKGVSESIWGKRVVLYSLSFPVSRTHVKLLEYLRDEGVKASLPSMRLSALSDEVLELAREIGQRTLTLAPETFSLRLQRVFFKYPDLGSRIVDVVKRVLEKGFNVKLYLIYGVKGERLEEVQANIKILRELGGFARKHNRSLAVSLNPLIPKPHTIFQWIGMERTERLKSVLGLYRRELKGLIESRPYDIEWGFIQALIALSGKPLDDLILKVAFRGGGLASWRRALREAREDYTRVLEGYEFGGRLPWDFIVLDGISRRIAESQYEVYLKLSNDSRPLQ